MGVAARVVRCRCSSDGIMRAAARRYIVWASGAAAESSCHCAFACRQRACCRLQAGASPSKEARSSRRSLVSSVDMALVARSCSGVRRDNSCLASPAGSPTTAFPSRIAYRCRVSSVRPGWRLPTSERRRRQMLRAFLPPFPQGSSGVDFLFVLPELAGAEARTYCVLAQKGANDAESGTPLEALLEFYLENCGHA